MPIETEGNPASTGGEMMAHVFPWIPDLTSNQEFKLAKELDRAQTRRFTGIEKNGERYRKPKRQVRMDNPPALALIQKPGHYPG
jgi:hypothetical protein